MAADFSKKGTPRKATPRKASPMGSARPSSGRSGAPRPSRPRSQSRGSSRPGQLGARAPRAPRSDRALAPAKAPKATQKPLLGSLGSSGKSPSRNDSPRTASPTAIPAFLAGAAKGGAPADALGRRQPVSGREARERHQRAASVKLVGGVVAAVVALGLIAIIVFFVLRDSSMFSVDEVIVEPTEHVSQSDVANLLHIEDGTTLLNFDRSEIAAQLKRDPWVGSVTVERQFPHTLKITVEEQGLDALVVMNSGSMGWYLGSSGVWIEPVKISAADGQSVNDAALALARSKGVLLITGVPATVDPQAGSEATDDVLTAVASFRSGFSADFSSKIVSYDASSADAISCVMESGVQVSLGSATNISYKEQVAAALLEKYAGQITYINVRTPSSASVRRVGSADVTQGSGADGSSATSGEGVSASSDGSGDSGSGDSASDGSSDGYTDVSGDEGASAESADLASDYSEAASSDASASGE